MITDLLYDGKPSRRKFQRERLKIGARKTVEHEPQIMGDIEDGVSHFLCLEHETWLPNERYDVTLLEKRNTRRSTAEQWLQGLADGTYLTRAEIARVNRVSRARVTQVLNEYERMNQNNICGANTIRAYFQRSSFSFEIDETVKFKD